MKNINKQTILLIIAALIIGGGIGYFFSLSSHGHETDELEVIEAGEQIWTCSMHPQIRQPEPGDCPICGMDLVPVEEEGAQGTEALAISMSPTAMQLANVSTAIVGATEPKKIVRLNGKVQEDERLLTSQSTHIPGRIESLKVNFTGEYVQKDQVIATIYSPELVTAQEELFEAQKIRETQPALFNAAKVKLRNWKLSDAQIENILEAGERIDDFPVRADDSGYVIEKMVNVGDYVRQGQTIYEIANLYRVWVLFDIYESDLPWIERGDQVTFTVQSLPGREFEATIDYIDPVIDPQTRVAQARVVMNNPNNRLKPEMFVSGTVQASIEDAGEGIAIPKSAVMWTGTRSLVYVKSVTETGIQFQMREVTLGPALGESYLVEEGLEMGEEIAVSGTFSIDAAAQLAGKASMMNPDAGAATAVHDHGEVMATPHELMDNKVTYEIKEKAKTALQPLVEEYLALKDALVNDDFPKASREATDFQKTLANIPMTVFSGDAHEYWMKVSDILKAYIAEIDEANSIKVARAHFKGLSEAMIHLVKTFDPMDQLIYVQHCPMADDFNGADWLSLEEKILNPYFGDEMLTCGSVKGSIE